MTLRLLDTFSGIGGFSLAARWVGGFETVAFVEREPFCQSILRKHWPEVPIHNDITTFIPEPGSADVVCGGFPCQDISTAGKQAGIHHGTRSGLFYELIRVIRLVRPQFVILENVSAILSNGLDTVLGELAEAGFDAEWACIPASAVGACHRRDRWWLVAYANSLHSKRWRAAGDLVGATGTGKVDGQKRERDGNAADDCGATASNANSERSQRLRSELGLQQSARQIALGWSHQPRMPESDWRCFVSEPVLRRGDDGFSNRVDRLKALGNAVVPQVAMIPLQRVLELSRQ